MENTETRGKIPVNRTEKKVNILNKQSVSRNICILEAEFSTCKQKLENSQCSNNLNFDRATYLDYMLQFPHFLCFREAPYLALL